MACFTLDALWNVGLRLSIIINLDGKVAQDLGNIGLIWWFKVFYGSMSDIFDFYAKLCFRYALGGYDGAQMMSTVEIFDPRANSWMVGEPMSFCRGYSGSVVLQECLYVIAGLVDFKQNLVDKVSSFWQMVRMV